MRISDWSSDVCSSELALRESFNRGLRRAGREAGARVEAERQMRGVGQRSFQRGGNAVGRNHVEADAGTDDDAGGLGACVLRLRVLEHRSEEHTSELQSLMRISYAVFCLNKKNKDPNNLIIFQTF